jgi:hypothetical protein
MYGLPCYAGGRAELGWLMRGVLVTKVVKLAWNCQLLMACHGRTAIKEDQDVKVRSSIEGCNL